MASVSGTLARWGELLQSIKELKKGSLNKPGISSTKGEKDFFPFCFIPYLLRICIHLWGVRLPGIKCCVCLRNPSLSKIVWQKKLLKVFWDELNWKIEANWPVVLTSGLEILFYPILTLTEHSYSSVALLKAKRTSPIPMLDISSGIKNVCARTDTVFSPCLRSALERWPLRSNECT